MKKLWHIWTAYAGCLLVVLLGMGWLTWRVLDLDRAELSARRAADAAREHTELQERVAMALWRMDWTLAPLIAQEITRPSYTYRSFLAAPGAKGSQASRAEFASPLLTHPSRFVMLNFDVADNGEWSSPQSPPPADVPDAAAAGVPQEVLLRSAERLNQLRQSVSFAQLLERVPQTLLPVGDAADAAYYDVNSTASGADQQQQEFQRRNLGMQNVARSQRAQVMSNSAFVPEADTVQEGTSRPFWIHDKLVLARRVLAEGHVRIQGCWLDWPEIQRMLQHEVVDLFPQVDLLPVSDETAVLPGRRLATLPVQLSLPTQEQTSVLAASAESTASISVIRISLLIAWCCLVLGGVTSAVMLHSVLALSERRAAFVSAVTHELRSPLTTFRMYAEMLAEGMVRDEQQRRSYLETLRAEADRLCHLVDNVLQYARLERGRGARRRVSIELDRLMRQAMERLPQRAQQAGMKLHEAAPPPLAQHEVWTDPAAVEQILFNLVDNACKYALSAQDRRIHIQWSLGNGVAQVRVADHGPGIAPAQRKKLFRPFSKTDEEAAQSAPGIGLGLALCQRLASEIGGRLTYVPGPEAGAAFLLELPLVNREEGHASSKAVAGDA